MTHTVVICSEDASIGTCHDEIVAAMLARAHLADFPDCSKEHIGFRVEPCPPTCRAQWHATQEDFR